MLAVGHAELAAAPVAVHHLALQHERPAEEAGGQVHLAGRNQAADLGRGDALPLGLHHRHDPGLELVVGGQELGSPLRLGPKRKFSPTDTRSAPSWPISTSWTNCSALREANSSSNGITTSSSTPSPPIRSRLMLNVVEQLGQRLGVGDRHRVRVEGQHGVAAPDDLPVAEVDAVEGADGDLARPGLARARTGRSGSEVTFIAGEHYGRARPGRDDVATSPRGTPMASRAPLVGQPHGASCSAGPSSARPWRTPSASSASSTRSGRKASACSRGTVRSGSASSRRKSPRRCARAPRSRRRPGRPRANAHRYPRRPRARRQPDLPRARAVRIGTPSRGEPPGPPPRRAERGGRRAHHLPGRPRTPAVPA